MGRPKGSRNKSKRKYTRRQQPEVISNGAEQSAAEGHALAQEIKGQLTEAPSDVAKVAINDLIMDLGMVAKIINGP